MNAGSCASLACVATVAIMGTAHACNEGDGCWTPESEAAALALLRDPGVREIALGGAGVAGATGPAAAWYNPALPVWQTGRASVGATGYRVLPSYGLDDLWYAYPSASFTAGPGRVSLSVAYLGTGDQYRTDEYGTILGTFHTYTAVASAGYAMKISDKVSVGVTAKWFRDHLVDTGQGHGAHQPTGSGFAFDAGVAYRPWRQLTLGVALRDYGPDIRYVDALQTATLPVRVSFGTDLRAVSTTHHRLTLAADAYKPLAQDSRRAWYLAPIRGWYDENLYKVDEVDDGHGGITRIERRSTLRAEARQIDAHAGAEYAYRERVMLRGGFYRDWDGGRRWFTYGAGVCLPVWKTAIAMDVSRIQSIGGESRWDPNDGRWSWSLGMSL